jgi:hypothetical protein
MEVISDLTSVQAAHAKLETHEKICAERYANINHQLATLHSRLDAMSNRMWAAAAGSIVILLGAVGATVFALITGRHG